MPMTEDELRELFAPRNGRIQRGAERLPALKGHDVYDVRYREADAVHIYAYLDQARRVLYVGKTGDIPTRNAAHHEKSPWYPLAVEFRVLWKSYDSTEARAAEIKAIRELRPLFNVQHNRRAAA